MGFFEELQQSKELLSRTSETLGGVYGDPFNEVATIVAVSDPKKLGRVKVEYADTTVSDWIYVLNNSKGVLSAQYIGASVLIGKAHGNSHDAFVIGFFNKDAKNNIPGAPTQISIINLQKDANRGPMSPGDRGVQCNELNVGKIYLMENEQHQDVVICKRINNFQEGSNPIYNWWSVANVKWVEKGNDPGVTPYTPTIDISEKKGIPSCSKEIEGQTIDFAEDRKYRNYNLKCSKDENGDYTWKPAGATPVFFRTTLPKCSEKTHGMDAVLDEGLNSSPIKCVRYQGQMKWVMTGKREPMQFYGSEPPLSRQEFLDSKKVMPKLQDPTSSFNSLVGSVSPQILSAVAGGVPAVLPTSPLGAALVAANAISGTFDGSELLSNVAKTVINGIDDGEFSVDSLLSLATSSLTSSGITDQKTANILSSLGSAGAKIIQGLQDGSLDTDEMLQGLGQDALRETFRALSPELGSVYYGYMTGGLAGAIDSAAMVGLPQLVS